MAGIHQSCCRRAVAPSYLFDPDKLTKLKSWNQIKHELGRLSLIARPLCSDDYHNGYLELLSQLTTVGTIDSTDFSRRFDEMRTINDSGSLDHYNIVVIEDTVARQIVGASTLFLEYKFIHQCAYRGRLEDVAVSDSYRGKNIGHLVVKIIVDLAHEIYHCYKLTLDCKDELVRFYAKNNFKPQSQMLGIRFDD